MKPTNPALKLSFLIAAHNEEKLIAKTLQNLIDLPYNNYEIIIGLDGCTDRTEKIIMSFNSKKITYYKLNLRQGKPAVINSIIKHATGDIVIINDADWIFKVHNDKFLKEYLSVFDNPRIGGIAESFPVEWTAGKQDSLDDEQVKHNLGYEMVAHSTFLWLKYLKEKFSQDGIITQPSMFLTNVFRRSLFKENSSLGDDFERTRDIMNEGYEIAIIDDVFMPRMQASYDEIKIGDLYKQKVRTAIARRQLEEEDGMKTDYVSMVWYMFTRAWQHSIKVGWMVSFWLALGAWATLNAKLKYKNTSTLVGWTMRAER